MMMMTMANVFLSLALKEWKIGLEKAMDGKSIMDQERPLLAFLSSFGLQAMVIHYNGTEIKMRRRKKK